MKIKIKYQVGFSLIELAIVIVIIGFLIAALLLPLQAQRNLAFQRQTEVSLENAKQALLGFAQANGRLPCPATNASNGMESPAGGGICSQQTGFFPSATLGVNPVDSTGFVTDGWSNRIRYAVTTSNANAFTTSSSVNDLGITTLTPDLKVCEDSANCSATKYLTNNAVAVIFSTGANFGVSSGVDEASNLGATTIFYSRTSTAATLPLASSKEFDDIVTWISPYVLYNAMIQAGQLH